MHPEYFSRFQKKQTHGRLTHRRAHLPPDALPPDTLPPDARPCVPTVCRNLKYSVAPSLILSFSPLSSLLKPERIDRPFREMPPELVHHLFADELELQ